MRKILAIYSVIIVLYGCSENPESHIPYIEGYWEIKMVTFPSGAKKAYNINETIDFISINDELKGFRKKLKPGINNRYYTSDDAEAIQLKVEDDSLRIYYTTPFNTWRETVVFADENTLEILNENKALYLYNRYESLQLTVKE